MTYGIFLTRLQSSLSFVATIQILGVLADRLFRCITEGRWRAPWSRGHSPHVLYIPMLHDPIHDAVVSICSRVRYVSAHSSSREHEGTVTHPVWSHLTLSNRSSRAIRKARRYFGPSFSSSAMTQSVMVGMTLA